jgi:hypothetical protein
MSIPCILCNSLNALVTQATRYPENYFISMAVYLPLKKGKNELWLAVTEDFPLGGWGRSGPVRGHGRHFGKVAFY